MDTYILDHRRGTTRSRGSFGPRSTLRTSLGKTSAQIAGLAQMPHATRESASSPAGGRAQEAGARAVALLGGLGDVAVEHDGEANEEHAHLESSGRVVVE